MYSRRSVLGGATLMITALAGCSSELNGSDPSTSDSSDASDILNIYEEVHSDFDDGLDDFEKGEEEFQNQNYIQADRAFNDANEYFDSAGSNLVDAETEAVKNEETRNSTDIFDEARNVISMMGVASRSNMSAVERASEHEADAKMMFQSTTETIEEEIESRSIPSQSDLESQIS